jgi:molybdenum cofactor cytidylyltransferase
VRWLEIEMNAQQKRSAVAAVVLAAGMSRRMGTPKQLLRIGGKTILEDTLQNVCGSNIGEIILVLGHGADDIQKTIATENLKVVVNPDYQQGMGTSLRSGLAAVSTDATAALIVLADQPWVTAETLNSLIACHQSEAADHNSYV